MTAPVTVTGGSAGITASVDDLASIIGALRETAGSVREVHDDVSAPLLRVAAEVGAERDLIGSLALDGDLDDVGARLAASSDHVDELTVSVGRAMDGYAHVEDGVLADVRTFAVDLAGGIPAALGGNPLGGLRLFSALPSVTDLLARSTTGLGAVVAVADPDGHAVLHDLGIDHRVGETRAPRSLAELIDGLALRNEGRHGEISVSFVVGADGRRRAIVDVPGTKSWNPVPNHDVTSVGTDVRAIRGLRTSYEDGVLAAMTAAGVDPHDEVLLVGHSEGGIVAVNAARDAVRAGRFDVTHVVTAGSPIGRVAADLPSSVQVLALENAADVVPDSDGAANPDRRNVVTAQVDEQHYSVIGNHDLPASYHPVAEAVEHSCNESVDSFLGGAARFLDGGEMRTHAFLVTRGF